MAHPAVRQIEQDDLLAEREVNTQMPNKILGTDDDKIDVVEKSQPVQNSAENTENYKAKDGEMIDGKFYHYTIDTKDPDPWLKVHKVKIIVFVALLVMALVGNYLYQQNEIHQQTKSYIASPQIGDLYYLDFRLIQDNLRPSEKFRMAKVTDLTGDVVTLKYSSYFYLKEHELTEAIRYGQLRFGRFFQERGHDFTIPALQQMIKSGAIVLARRPDGNVLDGNVIVPDKQFTSKNSLFIPGKKENATGMELLKLGGINNEEQAYKQFSKSAAQGYPPGQVNLAQLYLTGKGVSKDAIEALAILKQAALSSHEPAVLKYRIVCKQIESCTVKDFYQELIQAGVNIKFLD